VKLKNSYRHLGIVFLRAAMIAAVIVAAWLIYQRLPPQVDSKERAGATTNLQIVLRQPDENIPGNLNVNIDLYPVDLVAVQHEYFTERRAGKPFWDFLKQRMKGRSPVTATLDKQGHGSVLLSPGTWWLHATLSGDEELEWRLPISISGSKQIIELTSQNAYTRSKTF
jgi:hypothetical protein